MASIDSHLVAREIHAINGLSQGMKKQIKAMFKQLESDPSAYRELDAVDPSITSDFPDVTLRKAYIRQHRHNFRVIFAHWKLNDDDEHVDLLVAFPRKENYDIDWEWIAKRLEEGDR